MLTFEIITGTLPHTRDHRSLQGMAGELSRQTVERPSAVRRRAAGEESRRLARRVAGDLDLVVLTALHRDPARRYPSAAAFADDLARALAGRPVRARPDTTRYRLRKFVGRNRLAVTAAALGLAALVGGLGMALWQAEAAREAARRADAEARRAEQVKAFLLSVFEQSDPDRSQGQNVTARELLANGARRIEVELAGEPAMQAEMLDAVARSLASLLDRLARTPEALRLLERAIATQRAVHGPRHPDLAQTLFVYGVLLLGKQQPAADGPLREALSIYGSDRFEGAHCLRYLGLSAMNQRRYEEAAGLFARAADIYAKTLGLEDTQHWRALANLGWAHLKLGRVGLARRELATAVTRIERLTGPESYDLRLPLKQLGETLTRAGAYDEAISALERVRRREVKLFGTTRHLDVPRTDLLLARAQIARGEPGDREAARRSLEDALAVFSGIAHPQDPLYFEILNESRRLGLARD